MARLAQIDSVITDWEVSSDAMRQAASPVDEPHCRACVRPAPRLFRCPQCRVTFASGHVWWVFGAPQSGAMPGHRTGLNSAHRLELAED